MKKDWFIVHSGNLNTVFYSDKNEKRLLKIDELLNLGYEGEFLATARFTGGWSLKKCLSEFMRIYLSDNLIKPHFKKI